MAGNYIDMQGSVSTDLGKLVTIQLVPKKTAENNGETAILQQENFSSFATTGNQQPYNSIYSWGTDSTLLTMCYCVNTSWAEPVGTGEPAEGTVLVQHSW